MPTVFHEGPYRLYFYASDRGEPKHVHVERDEMTAKFWLEPVRVARSREFGRAELQRIQKLVTEHRQRLTEAWDDYFHN